MVENIKKNEISKAMMNVEYYSADLKDEVELVKCTQLHISKHCCFGNSICYLARCISNRYPSV